MLWRSGTSHRGVANETPSRLPTHPAGAVVLRLHEVAARGGVREGRGGVLTRVPMFVLLLMLAGPAWGQTGNTITLECNPCLWELVTIESLSSKCDVKELIEASKAWAGASQNHPYITTEWCEGPCRLRQLADAMEYREAIERRWRKAVEACR